MNDFVKITTSYQNLYYIRRSSVVCVELTNGCKSRIHLVSGHKVLCETTPEETMRLIFG